MAPGQHTPRHWVAAGPRPPPEKNELDGLRVGSFLAKPPEKRLPDRPPPRGSPLRSTAADPAFRTANPFANMRKKSGEFVLRTTFLANCCKVVGYSSLSVHRFSHVPCAGLDGGFSRIVDPRRRAGPEILGRAFRGRILPWPPRFRSGGAGALAAGSASRLLERGRWRDDYRVRHLIGWTTLAFEMSPPLKLTVDGGLGPARHGPARRWNFPASPGGASQLPGCR